MSFFSALICVGREGVRCGVLLAVLLQLILPSWAWAGAPAWWAEHGVIAPAPSDNYAAANQGQLKNIAQKAYLAIEQNLPGGAGPELTAKWADARGAASDYNAVNLGQLKAAAMPFYDRLGLPYPWLSGVPDNYALANIGQVKNLFSFPISGAPVSGTYISLVRGNNQVGVPGELLPVPLEVQVLSSAGLPLSSTSVAFAVLAGGGGAAEDSADESEPEVVATTDVLGHAKVFLTLGSAEGVNRVRVSSGGNSASFVCFASLAPASDLGSASVPADVIYPAPTPGGSPTALQSVWGSSVELNWNGDGDAYIDVSSDAVDNASAAIIRWHSDSFATATIQKRVNLGEWVDFAVNVGSGPSFGDSGLLCGNIYEYRIVRSLNGRLVQLAPACAYYVPMIKRIILDQGDTARVREGWFLHDPTRNQLEGKWGDSYKVEFYNAVPGFERKWIEYVGDIQQGEGDGDFVALATVRSFSSSSTLSPSYPSAGDVPNDEWAYGVSIHEANFVYVRYLGKDIPAYAFSSLPDGVGLDSGSILVEGETSGWDNWAMSYNYPRDYTVEIENSGYSYSGGGSGTLNSGDEISLYYDGDALGEKTALVMIIPNGSVIEGVTAAIRFSATVPAAYSSMNIPASESSGAKYRKIALNGAPLSDEKPQQEAESDQAREETFIDALTLGLRHDTTDVYQSVPSSDLYLGVRRSVASEVWNMRRGLRPGERPDRPFGAGWSSNLAAGIEITKMAGETGDYIENPDTATVTDENGAQYTFAIVYGSLPGSSGYGESVAFVPLPTSRHEQSTYLASLSREGAYYVFKHKYGSTLTYEMTTINLKLPSDRIDGSPSGQEHTWARLKKVEDRYGNILDYHYGSGSSTLVPWKINVRSLSGGSMAVYIAQNTQGLVTDVWDSMYHHTRYEYASAGGAAGWQLSAVINADEGKTKYEYLSQSQAVDVPDSVDSHDQPQLHFNLSKITDPLGRSYGFAYEFDRTKFDYTSDPDSSGPLAWSHYYIKPGVPMYVSRVTLPDRVTQAKFSNAGSEVKLERTLSGLEFSGVRTSSVIDALGNERVYDFGEVEVQEMEGFASIYYRQKKLDNPRMIYYKQMTITSYDGAGEGNRTRVGDEVFKFSPMSGMSLVEVKDFSGNITQYTYGDSFNNVLFLSVGAPAMFYGYYADPTAQTNAFGVADGNPVEHSKYFSYGANRVMKSSTDELETTVRYRLDSEDRPTGVPADSHPDVALSESHRKGRRLSETVTDSDGVVLSHTTYDYPDTYISGSAPAGLSLNFVTRKTVHAGNGFSGDPAWVGQVGDLVTEYIPDASGRVFKEIVDPAGLNIVTEYTYDLNGNKESVKDPNGNLTRFTYDARNRLTHVTYADAHQKRLFYDLRGNKIREEDENGVATFWEYDDFNRITRQAVDMNGNGSLDASVDLVTVFTYNTLNAKKTVVDPMGTTTAFEYDAIRRLTRKTDDAGGLNYITHYEYGANSGGTVFDSLGFKPTLAIDPRGYRTEIDYDSLYRPVEERVEYRQPGVYAVTSKEYDDLGSLLKVTDPLEVVTETTYDGLRRPWLVTKALGTAQEVVFKTEYTSTGFAWKTIEDFGGTGHLNRQTESVYDAAGRVVQSIAPAVYDALNDVSDEYPVTTTFYDNAGNVTGVRNPLANETNYIYDSRNRREKELLPEVTDATSGLLSRPTRITAYDGVGNVIAVQDARKFTTLTEYDAARRPVKVTAPAVVRADGTSTRPVTSSTYDKAGNVLTVTDANRHVTVNTYDTLNRLVTTLQKPDADSTHDILVRNEYDAAGNRTAVIDGKLQRTEFTYDGLNRNLTIKDPADRLVTFTYDGINKTSRVDSEGRRTEYGYDEQHRLADVFYVEPGDAEPYDSDRSYEYDLLGQLLAVTEVGVAGEVADVAYTYDALGRQETETSNGKTHEYGYDLAGNRVKVVYGGTGTVLESGYDVLNRLEQLTEGARETAYGYDLNGNRVSQQLPNGETVYTQYDSLNRTTAVTTSKASGAPLIQLVQFYDAVGNLVKLTERHFDSTIVPRAVTNTYDNVNRLKREVNVEGDRTTATEYSFDTANNRTAKAVATTEGGSTALVETVYVYNNLNQLQTATEDAEATVVTSFTYDLNGNRKTRTKGGLTETYAYDYENRLVSLTDAISSGAASSDYSYVYDYRTRRVERNEAGVVTRSVFSGGVSVAEYLPATPTVATVEYIRGSDWGGGVGGLLYSTRSGVPSFKHYNSRGDVISETDGTGVATWTGVYEAYGTRTQEVGATQDRQKANTKEEDPTGLLNEGFRYRDLETGVFITRDPLGFVDGPNMYAYVVQNPWSRFDPEGLSSNDDEVFSAKLAPPPSVYLKETPEDAPTLSAKQETQLSSFGGSYATNPVRNSENLNSAQNYALRNNAPFPTTEEEINNVYAWRGQQRDNEIYSNYIGAALSLIPMEVVVAPIFKGAGSLLSKFAAPVFEGGLAVENVSTQTFFRTMSQGHYEQLLKTGKIPATGETFISPSLKYAQQYEGVTVQFTVSGGTAESLMSIGVRNAGLTGEAFQSLPLVQKGWTSSSAFFKLEGDVINIGLGKGAALEMFNTNILTFGLPK